MKTMKVIFHKPEEAAGFVNAVRKYDYDIDLLSGSVEIDAKSGMGVMAMIGSGELLMRAHSDDCDDLLRDVAVYKSRD